MEKMRFTFSDTIAGYVTAFAKDTRTFDLKTSDERVFQIILTDDTYGETLHNLGEPFQNTDKPLEDMLIPGVFLFVSGIFYSKTEDFIFEAKRIIFPSHEKEGYRFEEPDWWIQQIRMLAEFYFHAQFPEGNIDYSIYRTYLTLEGQKIEGTRQETDTISRMTYGFATAYMLTGEDRYLEAAEKGTLYLREHMRVIDEEQETVYWYHAMDVDGERKRKIFASKFGDDYNAIPAYEQIYALVGPIQTYRVTGDPLILRDAEMTLNLFNKFFLDREKGGYFSHIHPVSFSPHDEDLGDDRARKNWNSIGDHAPAYMINLWLATGEQTYADFLQAMSDTIEAHFQDYEHSPFVQERFHEDWSHDTSWGWQQNRAVIGHNLKIAWNLMRVHHLSPNERYEALARKIAAIMPTVGMDCQRAGWYDMIERISADGKEWYRFPWHDRKAWWQQEQAILAYLILYGSLQETEYHHLARESEAFYNAFFLDHDSGGVYFNVQANGVPFLVGTERLKGSHSMSGYHSFELCYLAAVYTNLLITKQPLDLYFKPQIGTLKENILRVQPDILPPHRVVIDKVWINDQVHNDFDPIAMTIKLPAPKEVSNDTASEEQRLNVKVRFIPTEFSFNAMLDIDNENATLTLRGKLEEAVVMLQKHLDKVIALHPKSLVLSLEGLQALGSEPARMLSFMLGQLPLDCRIYVKGADEGVQKILQDAGLWEELQKSLS